MMITSVHGINEGIDEQYCAEIKALLTEPCIDHGRKGRPDGYCLVYSHMEGKKVKNVLLHRKIYCMTHKLDIQDIKGLVVMHLCDNPRCVEPTHLRLGTQRDNMMDAVKKGRRRNHRAKANPHKYFYREWDKYDDTDYVS